MRGVGLDRSVRVLRVGARVPREEVEHLRGWIPLHRCSYGGLDCLKCEHATQFFSDATQLYYSIPVTERLRARSRALLDTGIRFIKSSSSLQGEQP